MDLMSPQGPYKREAGDQRNRRGEGNVTMEAETGVMQPQTRACRQPPKAGGGKEQLLLCSLQKDLFLPTPSR